MTAGYDHFYFRLQPSWAAAASLARPSQTSGPAGAPAGQTSGRQVRAGAEPGRSDSSARRPLSRPATTAETTAETVHTPGLLPSPGSLAELSTE